jgi:hypothetical protein
MKVFDIGVEPVGFIAIGVVPRGVIAIGPLATGVVAIGQIARGFIAIGQLAIGVLSIGQLSVGMWWASGQLAMAPVGGPAMLRLAPFGTAHPIRWIRGDEVWREAGRPKTGWRLAASAFFVIAVAVLVWFVAVMPAREALFGTRGVFGALSLP